MCVCVCFEGGRGREREREMHVCHSFHCFEGERERGWGGGDVCVAAFTADLSM